MIVLIAGASHTGKTVLAQKLLEKHRFPYLSIDHLKMGLIRANITSLTPEDDDKLTVFLWPIVREIIKTAIENKQNLIVEGIYIPFDWKRSFEESALREIRYTCLIMTEHYIKEHFDDILRFGNCMEARLQNDCEMRGLIRQNAENLRLCREHGCPYVLIDEKYDVGFDF